MPLLTTPARHRTTAHRASTPPRQVARYAFDEEQTRQYLPLDSVLEGLFGVCRRLFGVEITQVEPASVGAQVGDAQPT